MGNKMDYISTLIDLNILCLLDLVWWSHLFSPWWDLQKIILFTNLFSVSIWFTKCDDGGSNFASSWWPHFYRLTLRHVIAMLLMSVGLWSFKFKGAKLVRFLSYQISCVPKWGISWKFQLPKKPGLILPIRYQIFLPKDHLGLF